MARNLIHEISPPQFRALIDPLVAANHQPLPLAAKQFLAVVELQKTGGQPGRSSPEKTRSLIVEGHTEINRGLRPGLGRSARFYADQLFNGPM